MSGKYEVLDTFTVNTPSLSVVIRADDTPLPSDLKAQPNPANLVTVHAVEGRDSAAPRSEEAWGEEAQPSEEAQFISEEDERQAQEAARGRFAQQNRLMQLNSMSNLNQSQLMELKELQDRENAMLAKDAERMHEQAQYTQMLRRAESKYADLVYNRFGAPPPIKPLDAVVSEEDNDGFIKRISTYETKDFTYWDKLRRHNTETQIRRWHTYMPFGEEETAFFLRDVQADVGGAAYTQGAYYKELEVGLMPAREYKLPTEAYVAPPVYVRRTGNYEKRIYDPIRQMARRAYACSTCFAG